ncbi:hypothetical protein ACHQM5_028847 [Ranunculus cassubicifolius]
MEFSYTKKKALVSCPLKILSLVTCLVCVLYVSGSLYLSNHSKFDQARSKSLHLSSFTTLDHIVFGISSNTKSWQKQKEYIQLWWQPSLQGCIFLDEHPLEKSSNTTSDDTLPPICLSEDTSHFTYTHPSGLRSAIRVARMVSETISLNHSNVRWFVFGGDDTLFFPENLAKTLSKYDHNEWHYIGTNSESWEQNNIFSHDMAFGGAGYALSYPLAKVFAKICDSCLARYHHLYGGDARISSCLAELGISLTRDAGFHQSDVRGDISGLLAGHPLHPLVSLHHTENIDPIFPKMNRHQAFKHLFEAVKVDSTRILQQSVCYDKWYGWSILVSWGYVVQVFDDKSLVPDILPVQQTFKSRNSQETPIANAFMLNTRKQENPCRRPVQYFLEEVVSNSSGIWSNYRRHVNESCLENKKSLQKLKFITVFSQKLDFRVRKVCHIFSSWVLLFPSPLYSRYMSSIANY